MTSTDIQKKVFQLEGAISRLDTVKKHLNQNASDIKAEIHAIISRNLALLRSREVALLHQVDQVLRLKEETLQEQQARLNQALGVLRTGMSMVLEQSDRQMAETLEKLNRMELSPGETPYISFRADHVSLRESIQKFGKVDASGLPPLVAFHDPGYPSTCLPRHVEEYEDVDHHLFYKTLEQVNQTPFSNTCTRSVTVNIPKLSTRMEDWLQKQVPAPRTGQREAQIKLPSGLHSGKQTKAKDVSPVGVSGSVTPGSACSLNSWLSLIKQHADLEEEHNFEIVDHSSSTRDKPTMSSSPASVQLVRSELRHWLSSASASGAVPSFSANLFSHVPAENKCWINKVSGQQFSLEELKHKDFTQIVSQPISHWLYSPVTCQQGTRCAGSTPHLSLCQLQSPKKNKECEDQCLDTNNSAVVDSHQPASGCPSDTLPVNQQKPNLPKSHTEVSGTVQLSAEDYPDSLAQVFRPYTLFVPEVSVSLNQLNVGCPGHLFSHIPAINDPGWLAKCYTAGVGLEHCSLIGEKRSDGATLNDNPTNEAGSDASQAAVEQTLQPGKVFMDASLSDWLLVPAGSWDGLDHNNNADSEI